MDRRGLTQADEICLSQEFEVLRAWSHPNIIKAFDMFVSDQHIATVLDSCDGGNLMQRLVLTQPHLNELIVRDVIWKLLEIVRFIHEQDILHRDIKFINIVYSNATDDLVEGLKLSGLHPYSMFLVLFHRKLFCFTFYLLGFMHVAEASAFTVTEKCGTLGFIAPEVAEGKPYGKPVDLWAVGVVLYTMLGGSLPFQDEDEQKLLTKIKV